jgi:hypothetical protein
MKKKTNGENAHWTGVFESWHQIVHVRKTEIQGLFKDRILHEVF